MWVKVHGNWRTNEHHSMQGVQHGVNSVTKWEHVKIQYLRFVVLTVVSMRIQVFWVSSQVAPNTFKVTHSFKHQEPLTKWQSITSQNTQILTVTPVAKTLAHFSIKVVSQTHLSASCMCFNKVHRIWINTTFFIKLLH